MNKPVSLQQYFPEQTIQSYLDALLQDAAVELAMAVPDVVEAPPKPPVRVAAEPVQVPTPATVKPVAGTPAAARVAEPVEVPTVPVEVVETPPPAAVDSPVWRDQPFEALLFDVGGLTLAVPLVCLGTIHTLETEITPLFGQPDWFLGILPTQTGNLKVLDTARWVMPERYQAELKDGLKFVISVEGCDWGMAVHGVSKSIRLTPDQIKWRSQQGKRPWLAGTVIEHMCALLDVSALATLIVTGAANEMRTGPAGSKPVAKAPRRH
ncbi:chemotaxis protein CheW [Halopseudomonas nanhaiensis]|uniref:CheW domain-containing protein n=1 Tax=Halopseudomonas nanhaiensis TaxID=2830842 RepID=UPI001CBECA74|nr:CheW domain-containing protein [Halopseudomonas nanhaiensis]UAW99388.1 chemotaxis protein CheW [Halopseudomonas nanhaiensis]